MAMYIVISAIILIASFDSCLTTEYIQDGQKTPAFEKHEMYQDIFSLTGSNFSELVLQRPDPWVILFHRGMLDRSWKNMAVSLRGVLWVGMIDVGKNKQLLEQIDYNALNDTKARVYTYGDEKTKVKSWQRVSDPNTARSLAIKSIPDLLLKLSTADLEDFLVASFMSKPSRFPTVFLTEEDDSSALMKALAIRFKKYFNFGKITRPSLSDLRKIGLEKFFVDMPSLVVLVTTSDRSSSSPHFNAIPFDKENMGELNYPNVLMFLFAVNREYRHLLPAENWADRRKAMEMEDISLVESLRFNIQGFSRPEKKHKSRKHVSVDENLKVDRTVTKHGLSDEL